jgi:GxxExxY protein
MTDEPFLDAEKSRHTLIFSSAKICVDLRPKRGDADKNRYTLIFPSAKICVNLRPKRKSGRRLTQIHADLFFCEDLRQSASEIEKRTTMTYKYTDITDKIINAFYSVYNTLGYGFLEKVYRNAMTIELRKMNLTTVPEAPVQVYYKSHLVGEYYVDLLVESAVIVELKAARQLAKDHEAQLLNYLKATPYEVGLLLNFGPTPGLKRKAFDNTRKGSLQWANPQTGTDKTDKL